MEEEVQGLRQPLVVEGEEGVVRRMKVVEGQHGSHLVAREEDLVGQEFLAGEEEAAAAWNKEQEKKYLLQEEVVELDLSRVEEVAPNQKAHDCQRRVEEHRICGLDRLRQAFLREPWAEVEEPGKIGWGRAPCLVERERWCVRTCRHRRVVEGLGNEAEEEMERAVETEMGTEDAVQEWLEHRHVLTAGEQAEVHDEKCDRFLRCFGETSWPCEQQAQHQEEVEAELWRGVHSLRLRWPCFARGTS